jgi:hypothetical protein
MHPINDGHYAFESVRWPGHFVQDGSLKSSLSFKVTDLATARRQLNLQFEIVKMEKPPTP